MTTPDTPGVETSTCVEHGVWTPLPVAPSHSLEAFTLRLKDVDRDAHDRIEQDEVMTFHMVGCTGDYSAAAEPPQAAVAAAMAAQAREPGNVGVFSESARPASFFFHLGDIGYAGEATADAKRKLQSEIYQHQFYAPYAGYSRRIFAIAGNHDGKVATDPDLSAINHFFMNFCAERGGPSPDDNARTRNTMTQPYVYWRLTTPLAYIIGLYTNVANGGLLDDPHDQVTTPQYQWLVDQLVDVKHRNERRARRKAVVLALHYPPYSGAVNFAQRGDPARALMAGPRKHDAPASAAAARPLGHWLQKAFTRSGQYPDAVFSAHAHLYQRLTYRYGADGREIPFLIVGSGGHAPVEDLWQPCTTGAPPPPPRQPPFPAVLPPGLTLDHGDQVRVMAYNDAAFGFLRITIDAHRMVGEFFTVYGSGPTVLTLADAFALDLATRRVETVVVPGR